MIRLRFQRARERVHAWEAAWWTLSTEAMRIDADPEVGHSWQCCSAQARVWREIEVSLLQLKYDRAMLRLKASLNQ
jgi:hypothetical protein